MVSLLFEMAFLTNFDFLKTLKYDLEEAGYRTEQECEKINEYSGQAMRTVCISYREFSKKEWESFSAEHN